MKKIYFLLTVVICILFAGCRYTGINTPVSYGTIQFVNNHSDPYLVKVRGNTSFEYSQKGNSSKTYKVEVGYYNVHVEQQSGYLLYPTEKDYEFYVKESKNTIVSY